MAHPLTALHLRYLPVWFAYALIREFLEFQAHSMMSSDSVVPCWSSPTQPSSFQATAIGGYSSRYAKNLDPLETSPRTLGSRHSRLNLDANGSPRIGTTPGSKD